MVGFTTVELQSMRGIHVISSMENNGGDYVPPPFFFDTYVVMQPYFSMLPHSESVASLHVPFIKVANLRVANYEVKIVFCPSPLGRTSFWWNISGPRRCLFEQHTRCSWGADLCATPCSMQGLFIKEKDIEDNSFSFVSGCRFLRDQLELFVRS